jgi:hypothetical protein
MEISQLILGALCVWRITHLLSQEAGPGAVLEKLRRIAGAGFWGQLLACFYCLSLWVAVPFALLFARGWKECALIWPALSAAAILLERITAGRQAVAPGYYVEEREEEHVLR